MSKVKVVVDSTSDIPRNVAEELDIAVVALAVHFGDKTYLDGVDLSTLEFYDLLESSPFFPHTSEPSPEAFAEVYAGLVSAGFSVLSLHISSAMSGTYRSAVAAKELIQGGRIEVVDSGLVSMAYGLPAVAAARMAAEGRGLDEILARTVARFRGSRAFFAVDTLDYLQRNGRLGKAQAILGTLLSMKPILTFEDGEVAPYEKVRGEKKVIPRITEIMGEVLEPGKEVAWAVTHSNCLDRAIELKEMLEKSHGLSGGMVCDLGAVVGCHSGPGTVAVSFYQE